MDFGWHLPCHGSLATRENLILDRLTSRIYAALWKMTPSV